MVKKLPVSKNDIGHYVQIMLQGDNPNQVIYGKLRQIYQDSIDLRPAAKVEVKIDDVNPVLEAIYKLQGKKIYPMHLVNGSRNLIDKFWEKRSMNIQINELNGDAIRFEKSFPFVLGIPISYLP